MAQGICALAAAFPLASGLLSEKVVQDIESGALDHQYEVTALIELVVNTAREAAKAFIKSEFKKFDSNPGDAACQSRAAILIDLSQRGFLKKECEKLEPEMSKLREKVHIRKTLPLKKIKGTAAEFFKESLGSRLVSPEFLFLVHARMLTVLRKKVFQREDGIIVTRTDPSSLIQLSRSIDKVSYEIRSSIVQRSQLHHSKQSVEMMHRLAIHPLAKSMTTEGEILVHTENPKYSPKYFSCVYFGVMALLDLIERDHLPILLKAIIKTGVAFDILYSEGIPTETTPLDKRVVVIEGVAKGSKEEIIAEIAKTSLRDGLLYQASIAPPFHPKSTLEDIKLDEARKEVEARARNPLLTMFQVDHIYLTLLKFEKN